jgi:hypothetical protein
VLSPNSRTLCKKSNPSSYKAATEGFHPKDLYEYATDKLENYTLTFMLTFEENEEIVATARTPEEVKKVLKIE